VPLRLEAQKFDLKILKKINLPANKIKLEKWKKFVRSTKNITDSIKIAIIGKYFVTGEYQLRDSYAALLDALDHAGWFLKRQIDTKWINAENFDQKNNLLKEIDGIIVPIGWGARGVEGMISAITFARENKIPYLGLCYGMQLAAIEFARNVAGMKNANTVEVEPKTEFPIIHTIPKQKDFLKRRAYGGTMRLGRWDCRILRDTISYESYKEYGGFINKEKNIVAERHRHRYEFNDAYAKTLTEKGLVIAGRSMVENLVEIIELPQKIHPFFVGTQYHPEYKSRPLNPHPLFISFLKAC
jgi:CTP synthase